MNTITIELCAEDRARLDKILEALENASPRCDRCMEATLDYIKTKEVKDGPWPAENEPQEPKPEEPEVVQPAEEKPAQPEPESDSTAPAVTVEDIRSKVLTLTAAGKKGEIREIITAYAAKVSDIPEDKRAEVLEKLTALEG